MVCKLLINSPVFSKSCVKFDLHFETQWIGRVNGVKLRIALYPNGIDQEAVNHVSLAICNASGVAIDLLFDVNMGDKTKYDDCHIHFPAGSFGGRDKF